MKIALSIFTESSAEDLRIEGGTYYSLWKNSTRTKESTVVEVHNENFLVVVWPSKERVDIVQLSQYMTSTTQSGFIVRGLSDVDTVSNKFSTTSGGFIVSGKSLVGKQQELSATTQYGFIVSGKSGVSLKQNLSSTAQYGFIVSGSTLTGRNDILSSTTQSGFITSGISLVSKKYLVVITANNISTTFNHEEFTAFTYTVTGLVDGDLIGVLGGAISYTTSPVTPVNIGTYTITPSGFTETSKYRIEYRTGTLTILQKALSIIAIAQSKVYGTHDPSWVISDTNVVVIGLLDGDTLSGTLSRDSGSNAGTYWINQGSVTASSNYLIQYTRAVFTITKAYFDLYTAFVGSGINRSTYDGQVQSRINATGFTVRLSVSGTHHGDGVFYGDIVNGDEYLFGPNAGTYTLTVTIDPFGYNYYSGNISASFYIDKASQAITYISPSVTTSIRINETLYCSASGGSGTGSFAWSVENLQGSASFDDSGADLDNCVAILTGLIFGLTTISVQRNGDTNYNPSDKIGTTIAINRALQSGISCQVSPTSIQVNSTTATASGSGGDGTGDFVYSAGTGHISVNSSSGAVTPLSAGTSHVDCYKKGDDTYEDTGWVASNDITIVAAAKINQTGFVFTATPSSLIVGQALTLTLSGGQEGNYNLAISGNVTWEYPIHGPSSVGFTDTYTAKSAGTSIVTGTRDGGSTYNPVSISHTITVTQPTGLAGIWDVRTVWTSYPVEYSVVTLNNNNTGIWAFSDGVHNITWSYSNVYSRIVIGGDIYEVRSLSSTPVYLSSTSFSAAMTVFPSDATYYFTKR